MNVKRILSLIFVCSLLLASCGNSSDSTQDDKDKKYSEIYGTTQAVNTALDTYEQGNVSKAGIIDSNTNKKQQIGLIFEGMSDQETMTKILDLLDQYGVKSTFFLPGIKAAEDADTAKLVAQRGHDIGNFTLSATKKMQEMTTKEIITDMTKTNCILNSVTGVTPTMVRCNATEYTDEIRMAATASGLKNVVKPDVFFSYQSFKQYSQALDYIEHTENGTLISIKLDSVLDETEFAKEVEDERPADDKQAGIKDEDKTEEEDVTLVDVVTMVLKAMSETGKIDSDSSNNTKIDYASAKKKNAGKKAAIFTQAKTTKSNVGMSFRCLGTKKVLTNTLQTLKKYGARATFFVTAEDIENHKDWIKDIISGGHELGNAGATGATMTSMNFNEICDEINQCKTLLKEKFSYTATFFMPCDGKTNQKILEAASTMGYQVGGYNKQPIRDVKQSVNVAYTYFKNGFMRGDIVALRLDNYQAIDQVVAIVASKASNEGFSVTNLSSIYAGQYSTKSLTSTPGWNLIKVNANWKNVSTKSRVIERIDTKKKVVFFTFDDWGSDITINKILNILDTYGIKATFFVRANGPEINPNLLRAMAARGHQIANHTYQHKVLTKLSINSAQNQIVKAHQIMTQILGKSPTLYFRPPTYATNERYNKAALATGMKYILMSDVSTHDYEKSASTVVNYVIKNVQPGSIITMHMSDNSSASKAIPTLVKKLKSKGYTIGNLSNYLK